MPIALLRGRDADRPDSDGNGPLEVRSSEEQHALPTADAVLAHDAPLLAEFDADTPGFDTAGPDPSGLDLSDLDTSGGAEGVSPDATAAG